MSWSTGWLHYGYEDHIPVSLMSGGDVNDESCHQLRNEPESDGKWGRKKNKKKRGNNEVGINTWRRTPEMISCLPEKTSPHFISSSTAPSIVPYYKGIIQKHRQRSEANVTLLVFIMRLRFPSVKMRAMMTNPDVQAHYISLRSILIHFLAVKLW